MEKPPGSWHTVGVYIARCRRAAGLTQRAVAEQLGMTDRVVSDWERGVSLPSFEVMAKLLRLIGGRIEEAARLLLSEPNGGAAAAQMGVDGALLNALAGLPIDPGDARYAELAKQIAISPWLVDRWEDIISLTEDEFYELMDYLEVRRRRQRSADQPNP